MMGMKLLVLFVATMLATCHGSDHGANFQIFPLRMKTGLGGHYIPDVSCASWRLAVEAHNIINFKTVPEECSGYIGNYILGDQYRSDSKTVCKQAYFYARELDITSKDVFVLTVEPYNSTKFNAWVELGTAPALPESLKLYNKLLGLGIKVVFLTGRTEDQKKITAKNLKNAGFYTWTKLITKNSTEYSGQTAVTYKSAERKKLVEAGYRIIGNIGDQWSDILGTNTGDRTFKLPDPLYYIS
ncbi:Vegetative storage protein/acid phosphatase [Sesbania bispinosa]|nr:Vegetative storage protein/acid phosphatase [Sesbania bispinosa]